MRKSWIWFMLMLLPLRLWAGVAMAQTDCHRLTPHSAATQLTQLVPHVALDSHLDHQMHDGHGARPATPDLPEVTDVDSGHDGPGCITCAVCHLSAGLPGQAPPLLVHAMHGTPSTVAVSLLGHAWPPLIKPPIA